MLDSQAEVLLGGPVVDIVHEQTKRELDLISVIVNEFGSPASKRLVGTMKEVLADTRRLDYAQMADESGESLAGSQASSTRTHVSTDSGYTKVTEWFLLCVQFHHGE